MHEIHDRIICRDLTGIKARDASLGQGSRTPTPSPLLFPDTYLLHRSSFPESYVDPQGLARYVHFSELNRTQYTDTARHLPTYAHNPRRSYTVTGASSGFGRLLTELALSNGDNVVATLRNPTTLSALSSTYPASRLLVHKLDVTAPADIPAAFAAAHAQFGRVDVVFNNAGYGLLAEVEGTPDDVARGVFETNFWGAANVSREAVRVFREVNPKGVGGRLLTVSSFVGLKPLPCAGYYSAAKFGEWGPVFRVCGRSSVLSGDVFVSQRWKP